MRKINLAIVGASGLVGRTMLEELGKTDIKINNLFLFSSSKSKGLKLKFRDYEYEIEELSENIDFSKLDYALFATPSEISAKYIPLFINAKVKVIDNSSYFRLTHPLIVVGVNDEKIKSSDYLITNPNCCVIQSMIALNLINKLFKINKIIYSTYQAVSGAGIKGINDLLNNTSEYFKEGINHNLIPFIGSIKDDGISSEEEKIIKETKKILDNEKLDVCVTSIRVPVLNGHSVNIFLECEEDVDLDKLIKEYELNKYIKFYKTGYITPKEISGNNLVHICRLRNVFNSKKCLSMFVVADNVRVGAATNAVRILEKLVEEEDYV